MQAWLQFITFLELLLILGIPTQWRKVIPPTSTPKILGFIFDIAKRCFYIPPNKIQLFLDTIQNILLHKHATRQLFASVRGQLGWVSQVIKPSKAFLRELDILANRNCKYSDKVRLTPTAREDLLFWSKVIVSSRNCMTFDDFLLCHKKGDIHVWTDASGNQRLGIGGYASTGEYFQIPWFQVSQFWPWPEKDISGPELLALVVFSTFIFNKYPHKSITLHCDNKSVTAMIIKEACQFRMRSHMTLIRHFIATAFDCRCKYWIQHIPGLDNVEADNLSRLKPYPFNRLFTNASMDEHTQPFFNLNPSFPSQFNFQFINLIELTNNLLATAYRSQFPSSYNNSTTQN